MIDVSAHLFIFITDSRLMLRYPSILIENNIQISIMLLGLEAEISHLKYQDSAHAI
jgi:hypothetical protein